MDDLRDIVAYFCLHYPHKSELSKARLTKMVYLLDWKSSIERERQSTDIKWVYNQFGPYVDDVTNVARQSRQFSIRQDWTVFGNKKETISYEGKDVQLDRATRSLADFVIKKTAPLTWEGFLKLVYSTYPVVVSSKGGILDLPTIAARYRRESNQADAIASA